MEKEEVKELIKEQFGGITGGYIGGLDKSKLVFSENLGWFDGNDGTLYCEVKEWRTNLFNVSFEYCGANYREIKEKIENWFDENSNVQHVKGSIEPHAGGFNFYLHTYMEKEYLTQEVSE